MMLVITANDIVNLVLAGIFMVVLAVVWLMEKFGQKRKKRG